MDDQGKLKGKFFSIVGNRNTFEYIVFEILGTELEWQMRIRSIKHC